MNTAFLLKVTLSTQSDEDFKKVEERKRTLFKVEMAFYGFFCAVYLCTLISGFYELEGWNYFYLAFIFLTNATMAVATIFSAKRIQKHSKSVEKIGIKTRSTVMLLNTIIWPFYVLVIAIYDFLILAHVNTKDQLVKYRIYIVISCIYMLEYIVCAALDLMLLYTYWLLSLRLSA